MQAFLQHARVFSIIYFRHEEIENGTSPDLTHQNYHNASPETMSQYILFKTLGHIQHLFLINVRKGKIKLCKEQKFTNFTTLKEKTDESSHEIARFLKF